MKLLALFGGACAVVVLPVPLVWAATPALLVAARLALARPAARALTSFTVTASLVAAFFYAAAGPGPNAVHVGPAGLNGADFLVGLVAGLRLACLLLLFGLGARWLPARDLLPYAARGGLPAYLAGALLRTVPTVRSDAERLREAQVVRGHRFRAGPWGARTWLPFVVPLFVSVVRRAREQGIALHLAGVLPDRAGHAAQGRRAHLWATVAALAALAVAGRLALVAWPGVSLSFFVVFVAGVAFGPVAGLLVGILERTATDLMLSGLHPVIFAMVPVEGLLGLAAGGIGRIVNFGQRGPQPAAYAAVLAAWAGAAMTLVFSLAADTVTWALAQSFLPGLSPGTLSVSWLVLVLAGLAFNVPSLLFNAALFAVAAYPTLQALRHSGVVPAPAPARRPAV